MSLKARFRLARVLIAFGAGALVAALWYSPAPHFRSAPHYAIPRADWGHVHPFDGHFDFVLGPNTEQTRRYELGFGRVVFTNARFFVADDDHGTNAFPLTGETAQGCLYHAQGHGINVIVAVGKCVPGWATVTGSTAHAKEWVRIENLNPTPKVVQIQYAR